MHMLMLERDENVVPVKNSEKSSNNNNNNTIEVEPKPIANFSLLPQTGMKASMIQFDRKLIEIILNKFEDKETQQPPKLEEMVSLNEK